MSDQYNSLTRPLDNVTATTDPGVTSDSSAGYSVGSSWVNTSSNRVWTCTDNTVGAAKWTLSQLPASQYATAALQSATMTAAQVSGACDCNFENTGTTPGNLATPTATAIIANIPNVQAGFAYLLKIRNSSGSANTATITAGTGVTLTGTMTIAQNVTRTFVVTINSITTPAVTFNSMGVSAAAA